MDQEVSKLWVAALRSGEYRQGRNRLRSEEGFCCLGVLCDIAQKEGVVGNWVKSEDARYRIALEGGVLPPKVMVWADIKTFNGEYGSSSQNLSDDNDDGASFDAIATTIEKNSESL